MCELERQIILGVYGWNGEMVEDLGRMGDWKVRQVAHLNI